MSEKTLGAAALCACTLMLSGCGGGDNGTTLPPGSDQTRLRVIHAAPNLGTQPVDVQVAGTTVFTGVGFGQTSNRIQVAPGAPQITVLRAGTSTAAVTPASFTLQPGAVETLIIVKDPTSGNPQAVLLPAEDTSAPPNPGTVRLRFINAASGAGSVRFNYSVNGRPAEQSPDLINVPFLQPTPAQFASAGSTVVFSVTDGESTVSETFSTVAGRTYTVMLLGDPAPGADPGLQLQVFED